MTTGWMIIISIEESIISMLYNTVTGSYDAKLYNRSSPTRSEGRCIVRANSWVSLS
jgi:hypothetical protein